MFAKCEQECICFVVAIFALSVTVICTSPLCGLCPSGFSFKGCNKTSPLCERCHLETFKTGLDTEVHCTKCKKCIGRNNIVIRKCNSTHDTECRCRDGYFFDKRISLCTRCSKCVGKNNILVRRCHGTRDTVCRCKDGYFFDAGLLYCSRCSRCKRGQGVLKNCTRKANTVCEKCIKGLTFSSVKSKTESCRTCKICGENEETVRECSRKKDTSCKIIPENKIKEFKLKNKSKWPVSFNDRSTKGPKYLVSTTSTPKTLDNTKDEITTSGVVGAKIQMSKENESNLSTLEWVFIAAGVVVILLGLVVAIVYTVLRWRNRSTTTNTTPTVVKTASPYPHHHHHVKSREEINRLSKTPLMTGSTEMLRNANFSIIEELSSCLNPKGRWKSLAGKLGFTSKDIENFDIEPAQATEKMLSEWCHRSDSTVQKLYEVLLGMKLSHEADIVYKYLNNL